MPISSDNPDARAWLVSNGNPSALATNKFHTTASAHAFVEELYAAGAAEVLIDNITDDTSLRDGGPYADSLIVRLPDDGRQRWDLIERCEMEGEADGTCREREGALYLWWD